MPGAHWLLRELGKIDLPITGPFGNFLLRRGADGDFETPAVLKRGTQGIRGRGPVVIVAAIDEQDGKLFSG